MRTFINWLRCRLFGHARFKFAKDVTNEDPRIRPLRCPRCGAVKWVRANGGQ